MILQERSTVAGRTPSVNVPRSSSRRGPQIHRVDATGHCHLINGLRVTGVEQTLIELGRELGTHHSPGGHRLRPVDLVELALESALHQGLTTIEALTELPEASRARMLAGTAEAFLGRSAVPLA